MRLRSWSSGQPPRPRLRRAAALATRPDGYPSSPAVLALWTVPMVSAHDRRRIASPIYALLARAALPTRPPRGLARQIGYPSRRPPPLSASPLRELCCRIPAQTEAPRGNTRPPRSRPKLARCHLATTAARGSRIRRFQALWVRIEREGVTSIVGASQRSFPRILRRPKYVPVIVPGVTPAMRNRTTMSQIGRDLMAGEKSNR